MIDTKKQTVLYIDGQNFTTRLRTILRRKGVEEVDLAKFDFWGLLGKIFADEQVDLVQIYFAKLHPHKDTPEKSKELIEREEELKTLLEKQGMKYIIAGSVRPRKRGDEIEFVEKGVDIRIAVDLVKDVIDGIVGTVLLASSDSDMQPAVYEAKHRGAKVCYVGFESRMNRGLMLTTDRYALISNDDVIRFYAGEQAKPVVSNQREVVNSSHSGDVGVPNQVTPTPPVGSNGAGKSPVAPGVSRVGPSHGSRSHQPRSSQHTRNRNTQPRRDQQSPQAKPTPEPPNEFNVPPWTRKNI